MEDLKYEKDRFFSKDISFSIFDEELDYYVSNRPYKVLDGSSIFNDFYSNVLDWAPDGNLCVGLGETVFLYNSLKNRTSEITSYENDIVSSVKIFFNNKNIAVGTKNGNFDIFEKQKGRKVSHMKVNSKVNAIDEGINIISFGTECGKIYNYDIRMRDRINIINHGSEICALKYSHNKKYLASGGDDNIVKIFSNNKVLMKNKQHKSAVKAIEWVPNNDVFLLTGGGIDDKNILVWNAIDGRIDGSFNFNFPISSIKFVRDDYLIITSGKKCDLFKFYDKEINFLIDFASHDQRILATGIFKDNVVTAGADEEIKFYDLNLPKHQVDVEDGFIR